MDTAFNRAGTGEISIRRNGEECNHGSSASLKFRDNIVFKAGEKDMLDLRSNGDIYVRGKLVEKDKEVVDTLRLWLAKSINPE